MPAVVRVGTSDSMPLGRKYELLWQRDTRTLWINTPDDGIVPVGVMSLSESKVRLSEDDTIPGFLAEKIDNKTIQADSEDFYIYVPIDNETIIYDEQRNVITVSDNATVQKIRLLYRNSLVGIRSGVNVVAEPGLSVEMIDNPERDSVDVKLKVLVDDNTIKIQNGKLVAQSVLPTIMVNGVEIGKKRQINFVPSGNLRITGSPSGDRVDITIAPAPGSFYKDGEYVGTRQAVNFIEGSNVVINAADDQSLDRVNIEVSALSPTILSNGVEKGSSHRINFVSGQNVSVSAHNVGNQINVTIAAKPSNVMVNNAPVGQRSSLNFIQGPNTIISATENATSDSIDIVLSSSPLSVLSSGNLVGSRPKLNFIAGENATVTVTDEPGKERVNVFIDATHKKLTAKYKQFTGCEAWNIVPYDPTNGELGGLGYLVYMAGSNDDGVYVNLERGLWVVVFRFVVEVYAGEFIAGLLIEEGRNRRWFLDPIPIFSLKRLDKVVQFYKELVFVISSTYDGSTADPFGRSLPGSLVSIVGNFGGVLFHLARVEATRIF